jgi:hypothetical protein
VSIVLDVFQRDGRLVLDSLVSKAIIMSRIATGLLQLVVIISLSFFSACSFPGQTGNKGVRSLNSAVAAKITFVNKSGQPIKVYWIDFNGNRKLYQTLENNRFYEQQTFMTHPWLVTDKDDNAWDTYYPEARPRTVEIVAPIQKDK